MDILLLKLGGLGLLAIIIVCWITHKSNKDYKEAVKRYEEELKRKGFK